MPEDHEDDYEVKSGERRFTDEDLAEAAAEVEERKAKEAAAVAPSPEVGKTNQPPVENVDTYQKLRQGAAAAKRREKVEALRQQDKPVDVSEEDELDSEGLNPAFNRPMSELEDEAFDDKEEREGNPRAARMLDERRMQLHKSEDDMPVTPLQFAMQTVASCLEEDYEMTAKEADTIVNQYVSTINAGRSDPHATPRTLANNIMDRAHRNALRRRRLRPQTEVAE